MENNIIGFAVPKTAKDVELKVYVQKDENGKVIAEVEVTVELFNQLTEMDRAEANLQRKAKRYETSSIDELDFEGEVFESNDETPLEYVLRLEEEERVERFLSSLTKTERRRLQFKLDNPKITKNQIAKIEGVHHSTIYECFSVIEQKFKKFS